MNAEGKPGCQHACPPRLRVCLCHLCAGEEYAAHYDNRTGDCAKRAATVMIYLWSVLRPWHLCCVASMLLPNVVSMFVTLPGVLPCWLHPLAPHAFFLGCSDVADGGTTSFPRSPGYPECRALEALQARGGGGRRFCLSLGAHMPRRQAGLAGHRLPRRSACLLAGCLAKPMAGGSSSSSSREFLGLSFRRVPETVLLACPWDGPSVGPSGMVLPQCAPRTPMQAGSTAALAAPARGAAAKASAAADMGEDLQVVPKEGRAIVFW